MNKMAKKLNLKDTKFENPHGLSHKTKINLSTAEECAIISYHYL